MRTLTAILLILTMRTPLFADGGPLMLDSIPEGYYLHSFDDCGIAGRQPHVLMDDTYMWTFNTSDTDADLKQRSAVFSYKQISARYDDLDPKLDYILAMTYASDHVYNRIQSLEADGVELHGPLPLPKAKAIRVIVRVPRSVTEDGRMSLAIKIHGEVNATVSIIELWANAPAPAKTRLGPVWGSDSCLIGQVFDLAYEGLPGIEIGLRGPGSDDILARTKSDPDGGFAFDRKLIESLHADELNVTVAGDKDMSAIVKTKGLFFDPVRYRPMPVKIGGLRVCEKSLDGVWHIGPSPGDQPWSESLTAEGWGSFRVPGQWLQQGYDVPQDKPVAVATEFTVPKEWADERVFLRFDAVHAGTTYHVNGRELGYSENLFTPVEWEITDFVRPGANRLDMSMLVATKSEAMSYSSGYAFHNLGGIDRSVRIYALPRTHVRDLRVVADLDKDYRDGELRVNLSLDGPRADDLSLQMTVLDAHGGEVGQIRQIGRIGLIGLTARVSNPLKWTAETPDLYRLVIELKDGQQTIERVERDIGFRKIEIIGKQLFVNGKRVKLAGACHHEVDPLTGRADTMHHAEEDVRLIKAANLNYIRTSHYPPTRELLDACDRVGMYVEVEAPFCWVGPTDDMSAVKEVLTPTSAMVDYCHAHPSVIVWSIANESHYNEFFEISDAMIRKLDPTRPTTFNNPDPKQVSSIVNLHYPPMPFDELMKDDPRPLFLGEYFFPVCHEQTDVSMNPGLRELWGAGHANPDSDYAKVCAADLVKAPLKPGLKPGGWTYMCRSQQVIGGAMFASHDDAFYFSGGKHAGYAWHHGFWGLIDVWRRPKPEWWLSKLIFSPVWFPVRRVDFAPGQAAIRVPVENRYSFTDLKELRFAWEIGKKKGSIKVSLPPASTGEIEIPIPSGTQVGEKVILRVTDADGDLVNTLAIHLGDEKRSPLPTPSAGSPRWTDDGKRIVVRGEGFSFVLDRSTGDLDSKSPDHECAVLSFPSPHVTRYDFGDLNGPNSPPYAVFPDPKTRVVEDISVADRPGAVEIVVRDRFEGFTGTTKWLLDSKGMGRVECDYVYSGERMDTREQGMRMLVSAQCDEVRWRRWSEWDIYPDDFIGRTEGVAKAHRDPKLGEARWDRKPAWPWSLDETELGTADFRASKFNIYEASLVSPDGSGLSVRANADAHFRPALCEGGVMAHILNECRMGQIILSPGDHITGAFIVELLNGGN